MWPVIISLIYLFHIIKLLMSALNFVCCIINHILHRCRHYYPILWFANVYYKNTRNIMLWASHFLYCEHSIFFVLWALQSSMYIQYKWVASNPFFCIEGLFNPEMYITFHGTTMGLLRSWLHVCPLKPRLARLGNTADLCHRFSPKTKYDGNLIQWPSVG